MDPQLLITLIHTMALGNYDLLNAIGPLLSPTLRFALVKYGGGIVQMSGSIAGTTHARNRFGNYARARTKPIDPKSPRQVAARILVMFLAEQWRETPMTDAIRAAWQTYANSVNWLNKLGEVVTLTGFNHFIRSNTARICAGGTMVTAAPTDLGLPNADPTFAVTASEAAAKLSVTFDNTLTWANEDDGYLMVEMGLPQNATRNFFGGPYRFAAAIAGDSVTPPTSPALLDPPFTLTEGQKVWCRAKVIRADARVSTAFAADPFAVGA